MIGSNRNGFTHVWRSHWSHWHRIVVRFLSLYYYNIGLDGLFYWCFLSPSVGIVVALYIRMDVCVCVCVRACVCAKELNQQFAHGRPLPTLPCLEKTTNNCQQGILIFFPTKLYFSSSKNYLSRGRIKLLRIDLFLVETDLMFAQ